jgi:hypothetical protein
MLTMKTPLRPEYRYAPILSGTSFYNNRGNSMKPRWLIYYRWPITGQQLAASIDPDWGQAEWNKVAQLLWYSASLRYGEGELELWYKFGDPATTHTQGDEGFQLLATIANTEKNVIAALEQLRTWMEKME